MLSPSVIATIKSTLPFLRERGVDLTRRMYELLFQDPEIRELFDASHQGADGAQPRALAQAVLAYGEHIERPQVLAEMIERIAHRHVSLGIEARHYPVVGAAILEALRDLLGEHPDGEVAISAWKEAYGLLSSVFIDRERELQSLSAAQVGGWQGWRTFKVADIVQESCDVRSFILVPENGAAVPDYVPGQYVSVTLEPKRSTPLVRSYSLSDTPRPDRLRISVKREVHGVVSRRLHDDIGLGAQIAVRPPVGNFTLSADWRPIVLLSGGIGLTPMMSMLETLVSQKTSRQVLWAHATRDGSHHSFKDRVRALAENGQVNVVTWYEHPKLGDVKGVDFDHAGLVTGDELARAAPWLADAHVYICGPKPFMRAMREALIYQNVPPSQLHAEVFGPDDLGWLAPSAVASEAMLPAVPSGN